MKQLENTIFRRQFAVTMYKDLRLKLAGMSFYKDFVNDTRGDPYPVLHSVGNPAERVEGNCWLVSGGQVDRWMAPFFPYASYEFTAEMSSDGAVGFVLTLPGGSARLLFDREGMDYTCGGTHFRRSFAAEYEGPITRIVTCRPGAFDLYARHNGKAEFLCTVEEAAFAASNRYEDFRAGYAALCVRGTALVSEAVSYIDNGISTADIRPIRYENGEVMIESGRIYFTASIRLQAQMLQGVFSWIPGTAELELTGALFFDPGDGTWNGDVAASILYHREWKQWLLWVCSFSHGHILGHAAFGGDPRFGVNVIDIELMEKAGEGTPRSEFVGFEGDEDPDFVWDAEKKCWRMAICRLDPEARDYRYHFFESGRPFDGYRLIGRGLAGAETGGSFVTVSGERLFVCGNDYKTRSDYRIYSGDGMVNAKFDFPDGGFRGWGTLMPIPVGSRTRLFWLTFDRHNGSSFEWSYGNLYGFEGDPI